MKKKIVALALVLVVLVGVAAPVSISAETSEITVSYLIEPSGL